MKKKRPVSAYVFSVLISIIASVIAFRSISQSKIYADNSDYMYSRIIGEDLFTLFIAIPLLLISCLITAKGSGRGTLIWLGVLSYFIYTYSNHAFGIAYNQYYLFYIALFSLSLFAFIRGLIALDIETVSLRFSTKMPVKLYAVFLVLAGIGLAWIWLDGLLPALLSGKQPSLLRLTGTAPLVKPVLDLGILSPLAMVAGVWIWKRKPWGYVLTGFLLMNGLTMGLTFLAGKWVVFINRELEQFQEMIGYAGLTLITFVLLVFYLKNLREEVIHSYYDRISAV